MTPISRTRGARHGALVGILAALVVGSACSSDNPVEDVPDTGPSDIGDVSADADAPSPDAFTDVDAAGDATDTSDVPQPQAGVPELVYVTLTPTRGVYPLNLRVTPTATVYDQTGAILPDARIRWEVTPDYNVTEIDGAWRIDREGITRFRACTPLDETGGLNLCGWKEIHADAGAPLLEIFTPAPGAELLSDEHPMIHVTGQASDSNGRLGVFVNGERVTLDAEGFFELDVRPVYGVNHIEAVASDGLNRIATERGVDVMWSPYFFPTDVTPPEGSGEGTITASYPDAMLIRLNQRYFDSNEPVAVDPETLEMVSRDIAGLLEFVLSEIDILSYIPETLIEDDAFQLFVADATLGNPKIDIRVTRSGLEFFISMSDFSLRTDGAIILTDEPISLDGTIGLVASAYLDLQVEKRGPDAPLLVSVRTLDLALEDAIGEFEETGIAAIIELAEGLLFDTIEDLALTTIQDAFLSSLPGVIDDAIGSIESSLTGLEVPLDLGFGEPIVLKIDALLDSVIPESRAGLTINFGLDVATSSSPKFPESRGIASNAAFDEPPALFESSRAQVAVRVPLLNGLMHELWNSGLLDLDVSEMIPPELAFVIEGATIFGRLPPHLTPTRPGAPDFAFVLTLGQLEMEIFRADMRDRVGINVTVGANLEVTGGAVNLVIQGEPVVKMWLMEQLGPEPLFEDIGALESLFVGAIWPMVTEQLGDGLSIELPAIDMSALGEFAPRLGDLHLELVLDQPVEIREGYFVLDGAFEGVADLSE